MTRRTVVVVYAVGEGGGTGDLLGAATLIEPEFALVDPPLNETIARGAQSLRVGVFAAEDDIAEVIDVARVRVVPGAPDLVLLELAVSSAAPVRGVPVGLHRDPLGILPFAEPSVADIVAAVRVVLAEAPPEPGLPKFTVEDPLRWIRRLFGGD